jgi:hypothetical protein
LRGRGYGLHDEVQELLGFESAEAAHDVGVLHEGENFALGVAALLLVASFHVGLNEQIR